MFSHVLLSLKKKKIVFDVPVGKVIISQKFTTIMERQNPITHDWNTMLGLPPI